MSHSNPQKTVLALLLAFAAAVLLSPTTASAVELEPSNWFLANRIGRDVNQAKTEAGAPQEERNECTTASKERCSGGEDGEGPREFLGATGMAVNPETGDVYIADSTNHRVQVLGPEGRFLFMFGWDVNKTNVALGASATQQEKDLCNAESHDACGPGEAPEGEGRPGQIREAASLAVDPASGNVYVLDTDYDRVDEFTAAGEFALMVGGRVNKKGGTVCTGAEEAECQAGVQGSGKGEFKGLGVGSYGDRLAVGPDDHLLYVADEGRVQKFERDGSWAGEISLAGLSVSGVALGVAVDESGNVFVADEGAGGVHEYNQAGELQSCVIRPEGGLESGIHGIALDAYGRLGVVEYINRDFEVFLYGTRGAACGKPAGDTITPLFNGEAGFAAGLAYSQQEATLDKLYIADPNLGDVYVFDPASFPEAVTCPSREVLATSAVLCGEVNPNGLSATGFFKYGLGASLSSSTPSVFGPSSGALLEPVSFELTGLVPNQTYSDETFVQSEVGGVLEGVGGEPPVTFHTLTPPPEIAGTPSASDVSDAVALLSAQVNPEHAPTSYHFQYGPCATLTGCAGAADTPEEESSVYGSIAAVQGLTGLQPRSTYSYRLVADNRHEEAGGTQGGETLGAEGHFTTAALPVPAAQTGPASAVGAGSAVISGAVVPDGQPATYAFELGLYNGAATRFGVVLSGEAGASSAPVAETLALSGLQPGSTYAYRIAVKSGYGEAVGATMLFTTEGLPAELAVPVALAQLPVPSIAFPVLTTGKSKPSARKAKCAHPKGKRRQCAKSKAAAKRRQVKASHRGGRQASRKSKSGHDQHKHG